MWKLYRVPVPLTLELIRERLVKNFYRSKDAVEYDIRLLVTNAELFSGDDSDLTRQMNQLASDLLELLQWRRGRLLQQQGHVKNEI